MFIVCPPVRALLPIWRFFILLPIKACRGFLNGSTAQNLLFYTLKLSHSIVNF